MSAAWGFVAGWISCAVFIGIGFLRQRRKAPGGDEFQSTTQWLHDTERPTLVQVGRRWYPAPSRHEFMRSNGLAL